jgi:hypothetical protein
MSSAEQKLHPLDIRNWTKEEAMWKLFKAEMTYLGARGWTMLCGTPDDKLYIEPGVVDYRAGDVRLYSHEEALKIQKEKDQGSKV